MQGMQVQSLDREDPLEKEVATHYSILAWEIPWTEELGSYSPWDHKESRLSKWAHTHTVEYDADLKGKFLETVSG